MSFSTSDRGPEQIIILSDVKIDDIIPSPLKIKRVTSFARHTDTAESGAKKRPREPQHRKQRRHIPSLPHF